MIKNWPLQIVSKSEVFSLNHSSEKKMFKKKTFLHWIGWEIGTTFHEQLQCKLKRNQKKNVRLHLTPNWKWLLRHTCLYCWRNSALGSLMFGSSQKVMQKLNEDNKNKNQLCHNAPGSLHYLEIVAPRIMWKNITKAENIFLPLPEAGGNKWENIKWKQEDGNYCQKHEASVQKQLGLNNCVQNEFWTRVRKLRKMSL